MIRTFSFLFFFYMQLISYNIYSCCVTYHVIRADSTLSPIQVCSGTTSLFYPPSYLFSVIMLGFDSSEPCRPMKTSTLNSQATETGQLTQIAGTVKHICKLCQVGEAENVSVCSLL